MSRESQEEMDRLWEDFRQLKVERSEILERYAEYEKGRQQIYAKIEAYLKRIGATVVPKTPEGEALIEELRLYNLEMHPIQEEKALNSIKQEVNRHDREELRLQMASERQQQQALPPLHRLPR